MYIRRALLITCYTLLFHIQHSINGHKHAQAATCSSWIYFRYPVEMSFHTPSLGDEPSYQAVKAPTNPLSAYAFFFKVFSN